MHVRLKELQVERPRQWGGCWLCGELWQQLKLDDFWRERLGVSREGTDWLDVLKTLVSYRLIDPGSEWRLHREWYERSAMGDLLGRRARPSSCSPCTAARTSCWRTRPRCSAF